jgi:hypothetical protein
MARLTFITLQRLRLPYLYNDHSLDTLYEVIASHRNCCIAQDCEILVRGGYGDDRGDLLRFFFSVEVPLLYSSLGLLHNLIPDNRIPRLLFSGQFAYKC